MNFTIVVNEGPYQHQASDTAWHFAMAAIEEGHRIVSVFFYQDGVYNASRLSVPPGDDRDVNRRWRELSEQQGVDLVMCATAGLRRGMVDKTAAQQNRLADGNVADEFRVGGLGQLIESANSSERLLVFGD